MMPLMKTPKSATVAPPASAISSRNGVPTGAQNDFGSFTAPHTERNFCGHRLALLGQVDVVQRLDVVHHAAHLQRDAGRRNEPPGGRVDQFVLVARRVEIAQHHELDAVVPQAVAAAPPTIPRSWS